jgi:lipoyl-dependent peroxiredoxin
LPFVTDEEKAVELIRTTHGICPYSNATRGNIDVAMSVNGIALDNEADRAIAA